MTSATRTGVARRLFSILEAFEDSASPLRLNEIARRCGLSSATTLRMVRELVDWGALDRLEDGSYRVGMRMWAIGSHAPCVQRIQRETTWHLRSLAAASGRTVVLGAAVGGAVVIVDRALGPRRDGTAVEIGDRFPLHATAVGKVFLAAGDPPTAVTERYTRYTLDIAALSAPLARTRQTGIAREREEYRYGRYGVAIGIRGPSGRMSAALGVVGAAVPDEQQWVRLLQETVGTVTESIMRVG
ncbi:IclR family transcriptional regulator [Rhodococcus sp. SMB37]|uniref:IclR family transcriptional regulator n=1 Tax=Rhodococcus sp. SMB37 TaxID=2512213 RepID=UPI0010490F70|nr:IclR family transcriptional regulator C-terminal domain-containing protein [Rhodococcus sp. SMB37]TCN55865.1 IclR family transcriptional regulator [Rhodococcus sp. SMB37]